MSKNEQTLQDLLQVQEIIKQRAYEIGWSSELQSIHTSVTHAMNSLNRRDAA